MAAVPGKCNAIALQDITFAVDVKTYNRMRQDFERVKCLIYKKQFTHKCGYSDH